MINTTLRRSTLATLLSCCLAIPWAAAQAEDAHAMPPDLQRIADAGELVIGVRESAVPFSFLQTDGSATGYAIAVCDRVADALRRVLNQPGLRVRYNGVAAATRSLLVREHVVDMECGNTSNTPERAKNFLFSVQFGVEEERLITLASAPWRSLAELAGKRVLVTEGSTSFERLSAARRAGTFRGEVIPVRNAARGYYELREGRADAYVGSGEAFLGESLRRGGKASELLVSGINGHTEPLAIMMRLDRPGLKAIADQTILEMAGSGELARLYTTWFQNPMPSLAINLALEPSAAWTAALTRPSDLSAE